MKKNYFYVVLLCLGTLSASCDKEKMEVDLEASRGSKTELITLKSGVVVEKKGGQYFLDGDILLSDAQLKSLEETGDFFPKEGPTSVTIAQQNKESIQFKNVGVYPTPYNLWSMVRYTLHPNLSFETKMTITHAINHWEANTNVRFYNATGQPTIDPIWGFAYPYVEFTPSDRNSSFVGRIGGKQVLNLALFQPTSVVIHEIGHAIGLYHEMARPDRDNYVNININNVPHANRHNFNKVTNYYYIGYFDFGSIMMYGPFAFAIDTNVPVITKKNGSTTGIGNATGLSFNDRMWANAFYLPYIARSDTYAELAPVVYRYDNTVLSEWERIDLQAQLNNGNPNPPNCCRIPNEH